MIAQGAEAYLSLYSPTMSRTDLETPATLTTALGDTACLTYDRLDPAAIEASVRSSQSGAVVSFVRLFFARSFYSTVR